MTKRTFLILSLLSLSLFFGCELIRLTERSKTTIKPNPQNSIGTVYLFIQEVKNNNHFGATKLFIIKDTSLNAEEIYDITDKIQRFGRNISNREISGYKIDTLNSVEHLVFIEFDYLYEYFFVTKKVQDLWFIQNFGEKK
ncbi:MAG: hypothetical protein CH6_2889 [Candidatus Kapaibacterium sp.]|nr:MAG: hypothetical protein CH6_2889 [Candidatus Kapabacteria bacterium]